ncbi:hypothetical protein ABT234_33200 [Streptomyces sp. NPDC001586]|uniref:hypothetical protein n=1 Tax=Streptomyces sp. NPDC001586 TaxID=3154387 RepID=UPI00333332E5
MDSLVREGTMNSGAGTAARAAEGRVLGSRGFVHRPAKDGAFRDAVAAESVRGEHRSDHAGCMSALAPGIHREPHCFGQRPDFASAATAPDAVPD